MGYDVARQFNRRLVVVGVFLVAFGLYSTFGLYSIDGFVHPVVAATGVASLVASSIVLWWSARPPVTPPSQAPVPPEDLEKPEETHVVVSGVKFCRYCGGENKPDAVYCESCGRQIEEL